MRLAILFWCYKRPAICEDRLRLIRSRNPETRIYVLFGGEPGQAPEFEKRLSPYVDDFYVFRDPPPQGSEDILKSFRQGTYWKYAWGDLLIAAWHRDRGRELEWDSVVVVQWDMLVYGAIDETFAALKPGQILFSGLRPIRDVGHKWVWVTRPSAKTVYEEFLEQVRRETGFDGDPLCCVAIVMAFPREFLDRFIEIERPELGFLEYRLPVYAQAFGIPFCTDHPFRPWWGAVEGYSLFSTLRALPREIWAPTIGRELLRPDGARVFHPYWRRAPRGFLGWTWALLDSVPRVVLTFLANIARRLRAILLRTRP